MNKIRKFRHAAPGVLCISTAILFLMSACGGNEPPAPLSTFADYCKKENKNKRVALEGYVKPTGMTFCSSSCMTGLFERRLQEGRGSARVDLRVRSKNGMEKLKKRYRREDFTLYDKEGNAIKYGTAARVHGRVVYSDYDKKKGPSCFLKVDLIEKTTYKEKAPTAVRVPHSEFCADKYDDSYISISGLINLPSSLYCRGGCRLKLSPPGAAGGEGISAKFGLGQEPNQMQRLPRRYSRSLLKIRNATGTLVNIDRPVRLEGTVQTYRSGKEKTKKCDLLVERVLQ